MVEKLEASKMIVFYKNKNNAIKTITFHNIVDGSVTEEEMPKKDAVDSMIEMLNTYYKEELEYSKDKGLIPSDMKYYSEDLLIFTQPRQIRTIKKHKHIFDVHLPRSVYVVHQDQVYAFAIKERQPLNLDSELRLLPLNNFDGTGKLCLGIANVVKNRNELGFQQVMNSVLETIYGVPFSEEGVVMNNVIEKAKTRFLRFKELPIARKELNEFI